MYRIFFENLCTIICIFRPSDIGNEAIKLVTDESANGQVLLITRNPEDFTVKVENVQFNN